MLPDLVYRSNDYWTRSNSDVAAASLAAAPCVASLILLLFAARGVRKIVKSPYGTLCKHQMATRALSSLVIASFYFAVMLNIESILNCSQIFGHVFKILQLINTLSYVTTCFERHICIVYPNYHKCLLTTNLLRIYLGLSWIFSAVYTLFFSFYQCDYQFYYYGWVFTDTNCPNFLFAPFVWIQIIIGVIAFYLNSRTLYVIKNNKKIFENADPLTLKREINFSKLVAAQGLVFMIFGILYLLANQFFANDLGEWGIFWTFTFSYSILHLVDSAIMIFYNYDLMTWIKPKNNKIFVFIVTPPSTDE